MELNSTFDADKGLLYATLAGRFSLSGAKTTFMEILDAVVQHQALRVLVDARALTGAPMPMERYYYGAFVADATRGIATKHRVPSMPHFAYVMVEPIADPQRFGETAAINRGMITKVFPNIEEAEHWLEIK
ncbi:MAG: hypothetical protein JO316_15910 [Abitibacteriaceae bacterium]|nr:hypothetical protein [Abditibacteriaceae bacterium]